MLNLGQNDERVVLISLKKYGYSTVEHQFSYTNRFELGNALELRINAHDVKLPELDGAGFSTGLALTFG